MQKSIRIPFGSHLDGQTEIKGFKEFNLENKDKGKIGNNKEYLGISKQNKLGVSFSSGGNSNIEIFHVLWKQQKWPSLTRS